MAAARPTVTNARLAEKLDLLALSNAQILGQLAERTKDVDDHELRLRVVEVNQVEQVRLRDSVKTLSDAVEAQRKTMQKVAFVLFSAIVTAGVTVIISWATR